MLGVVLVGRALLRRRLRELGRERRGLVGPGLDQLVLRDAAPRVARDARIEDLIKEGQELLVQVTKEPIGTKGARITSYVTLPGRFLVLDASLAPEALAAAVRDRVEPLLA